MLLAQIGRDALYKIDYRGLLGHCDYLNQGPTWGPIVLAVQGHE